MADKEPLKPDKEKKKPGVEAPPLGEELLAVLQDFGKIDKPSALRELNVNSEIFDSWVNALEKGGWVKVSDRELEDYYVELTKKSREWITELKELKKEEEAVPETKEAKKNAGLGGLLALPKNLFLSASSKLKSNLLDLVIISAFLLTLYLIRTFIQDPNQFILNFLVAIVLFSVVLFVYRRSKEKLKTKTFFQAVSEFIAIMIKEWKVIAFSVFLVLLIYFAGWAFFYPDYRLISILMCTIVLSSIIQLFHPLNPRTKIPLFYLGMMVLVYSLLILAGMAQVTMFLFQVESRLIDIAIAIGLLGLVYLNRNLLGVSVDYFKKMISQEKM